MNQFRAQLRKEVMLNWPLFLCWLGLLLASAIKVGIGLLDVSTGGFHLDPLWTSFLWLVALLLSMTIFVQDPPTDSNAFWRTRPVAEATLWGAKLTALICVVVLPMILAQHLLTTIVVDYASWLTVAQDGIGVLLLVALAAIAGGAGGSMSRALWFGIGMLAASWFLGPHLWVFAGFHWLSSPFFFLFALPSRTLVFALALIPALTAIWVLYRAHKPGWSLFLGWVALALYWIAVLIPTETVNWTREPPTSALKQASAALAKPSSDLIPDYELDRGPRHSRRLSIREVWSGRGPLGTSSTLSNAIIELGDVSMNNLHLRSVAQVAFPDGSVVVSKTLAMADTGRFLAEHVALGFAAAKDQQLGPLQVNLTDLDTEATGRLRGLSGELRLELLLSELRVIDIADVTLAPEQAVTIQHEPFTIKTRIDPLHAIQVEVSGTTTLANQPSGLQVAIYNPKTKEFLGPSVDVTEVLDPWLTSYPLIFQRRAIRLYQSRFRFAHYPGLPTEPSVRNSLGYRVIPMPVGDEWLADARLRVYRTTTTHPVRKELKVGNFRPEQWHYPGQ